MAVISLLSSLSLNPSTLPHACIHSYSIAFSRRHTAATGPDVADVAAATPTTPTATDSRAK